MSLKIRKGDTVEVISGPRDEIGKRGEVIKVSPKEHRVVVQGINMRKKHQRQVQTQQGRNLQPGIVQFEGSVDVSNVMLVCPKCDKVTRVGKQLESDEYHRFCKECGQLID